MNRDKVVTGFIKIQNEDISWKFLTKTGMSETIVLITFRKQKGTISKILY